MSNGTTLNWKIWIVAVGVIGLAGCATQEGIKLPSGSGPSKADAIDFNKRNAPPAETPEAKASKSEVGATAETTDAAQPSASGPRVIIIGNVMSLHKFDEKISNQRYDNYLKKIGDAKPAFTREWYVNRTIGSVAVKTNGIPGLYSHFYNAEVPKDLGEKMSFASAFGTFMAGTSADLVAAEIAPPIGTWVTRILCSEKQPDFSACEDKYQRGLYQSIDGKEVDEKLKIKDDGVQIDLVTYQKKK